MKFYRIAIFCSFLWRACMCEMRVIDSLEILEALSQLALLRHHPQSLYSSRDNVTESFATLLQDLQNQNLTESRSGMNCSSLSHLPLVSRDMCDDGHVFKCLSANDMLELVPESTKSVGEALARLCPLLLLQLHNSACVSSGSDDPSVSPRPSYAAVWGYGLLFVTIISCCSLCGVVVLPLLSKRVYQIVLMLFEGLAVGSLVGSSLFHLIPQTFKLLGQDKEHNYLWRSLLIFGGIYLFYVSERLMKMVMDLRKKRKMKRAGYALGENSTEFLKPQSPGDAPKCEREKVGNGAVSLPRPDYEKIAVDDGHSKGVKSYPVDMEIANNHHVHHHEHTVHFEKGQSTIGTVAWMIIFGDGLHNFIDGLSIGAAFSESILAGVSISVAVVCEEFPHELGDFAVLLSAGMSMRQALLYNFLSAITCYLGLVVGILLGDLAEGAPYIFALAAGMFLYISLVDMMGELNEALEEARKSGIRAQLKVFLVQNVGIALGVAILFVMARYAEHFNFETLVSGEAPDDRVLQLYSGLQEAKLLHGS